MDGGKNRNRAKVALFAVYLAALLRITVFRHNFSLDHLFGGGTLNLSFFAGAKKVVAVPLPVCREYGLVCALWRVFAHPVEPGQRPESYCMGVCPFFRN